MKILAVETSTNICGLTYSIDGEHVCTVEADSHRKHAEVLPAFFQDLQNQISFHLNELDGIAISIGPGSFTGLRVGLSFAKGLAFSHNLPIIPVPTLLSIAQLSKKDGPIGVMLHSHGEKVYFQSFQSQNMRVTPSENIDLYSWKDVLNFDSEDLQWVHWGCEKYEQSFSHFTTVQPSSKGIAELSEIHFNDWVKADPKMIVPNYISSFNLGVSK